MRWLAVLVAALAVAGPALATTTHPLLDAVATRIAGQPVSVLCYELSEPGSPGQSGAWGYVYFDDPVEHMDPNVCEGALGMADPAVPDWKKALGALVLSHESYHLAKRYKTRGDEARTECRAIRHARYTMLALGATEEQAKTLMPFALSIHWRIAARNPEYYLESCKVPNYW